MFRELTVFICSVRFFLHFQYISYGLFGPHPTNHWHWAEVGLECQPGEAESPNSRPLGQSAERARFGEGEGADSVPPPYSQTSGRREADEAAMKSAQRELKNKKM